jgi:copper chaperone CopZ
MWQTLRTGVLGAALALVVASGSQSGLQAAEGAGQVTVKGVHLCCGRCAADVATALKDVPGVSAVAADRNSKVVTFAVTDAKAARAGVDALAKAGVGGEATHGEKALAFPDNGAKAGTKADRVTFQGVHLCCGGCVNGAKKAVQGVKGAEKIEVDRQAQTVVLIGSGIDVGEAAKALAAGGYYGKVEGK